MSVQVNLTYESIFDVLVREKSRDELQKLDDSFFRDVASYINNKNSILASEENKEKIMQQIQNTKRMLRELYERREKKIMNMALVASRTSPSFIDTSNMLAVERSLFEGLLQQLDLFRNNVLQNILNSRLPILPVDVNSEEKLQKKEEPDFRSASDISEEQPGVLKSVKFLKHVPSFVGKELEIYGPFESEQVARLPIELADILISKGNAVEVN